MEPNINETLNLPILALRGLTVFPNIITSFDVERGISVRALERAMESDQHIFLVSQREIGVNLPEQDDLYEIGTVARICQLLRVSDKTVRVMADGESRARLRRVWQTEPYLQGQVELIEEKQTTRISDKAEAMLRQTYSIFGEYAELVSHMSEDILSTVMDARDPGYLADFIAQSVNLRHQDKQVILEELRPLIRLRRMNEILAREIDVINLEMDIESKIRARIGQVQKNNILREQIKVLQSELGEDDDDEIAEYREAIEKANLPEEVSEKLSREVIRLSKQPYSSAEASVLRNYLDTCLEMPWNVTTRERISIDATRKALDRDHYGLEKVKERILEFVAVRQMNSEMRGQILCLVGPPGVGKTSIAVSVAGAMNRKLARLSLGGVRDEADIRGHRKTYVGAMPGRVIEALIRCGSMNPLMVLDEIDKLGSDHRGDPASALLEVLDSEQNHAFRDHFMELPVDLSQVVFITTANTTDTIPRPLLDRMEVIELTSYTDEEKLAIAKRHLLPKQLKEHGIAKSAVRISDDALRRMIAQYTKESGVRKLERQLGKLCRKCAMRFVSDGVKRVNITEENLPDFLGTPRYTKDEAMKRDEVGLVNGLAWTEMGGELLPVEVNVMEGTGKLELTGNLGEVMQESAKAAYSFLRSRAAELGIVREFYKDKDVHVHFPEGAVPKDGPSAGVAVATAMLSALTGRRVRRDIAMTGEITLRGRVLPIGGLKEKTMAALRSGIHTVIIPKENEKDLADIDQTVRERLQFETVETADAVFALAILDEAQRVQEGESTFLSELPIAAAERTVYQRGELV
ncbi:MAG: endopeptidase La [Oscillospiraceae bacterium]|nr:endopeptidase La [Oscillospiraceae bacterium]